MLQVAGRSYTLACRDGEEPQLKMLGGIVAAKAQDAMRATGSVTENRTLLVTALLLADELSEAQRTVAALKAQQQEQADTAPAAPEPGIDAELMDEAAEHIENLADRLEKLSATLEAMLENH